MSAENQNFPTPWWTSDDTTQPPPFTLHDEVPETPPKLPPTDTDAPLRNIPSSPIRQMPSLEDHAEVVVNIIPEQSDEAKLFMGIRIPHNTTRANQVAIRALLRYLTTMPGFVDPQYTDDAYLKNELNTNLQFRSSYELEGTRRLLFSDGAGNFVPPGHTDWTKPELICVRYYLIEFVVNYRTERNQEVMPFTMKGYILGLQRFFKEDWEYSLKLLEGDVFNCPKSGLMAVLNNRFSHQQSKGALCESHNVLSVDDLVRIYGSEHVSTNNPTGFQARIVFDLALVTTMRPTAIIELTIRQITKEIREGEYVWVVSPAVGSRVGASKTNAGGWNAVRERPNGIFVRNRTALNGILNIFDDITAYMALRDHAGATTDRLLLGVNHKAKSRSTWLQRNPLGRNTFSRIVKDVCNAVGVTGSGKKGHMTTHGLRATAVTLMLEQGHADSSVAMRTGHRDLRSLKHYQNLSGGLGRLQQEAILPSDVGKGQKIEKAANGLDARKTMYASHVEDGMQENMCPQMFANEDSRDSSDLSVLSNLQAISGGTFHVNVHNHYHYR